jgi:hypothetical protein
MYLSLSLLSAHVSLSLLSAFCLFSTCIRWYSLCLMWLTVSTARTTYADLSKKRRNQAVFTTLMHKAGDNVFFSHARI